MKYKLHFTWKIYLLAGIGAFIIVLGATNAILKAVTAWFDTHTIQFNKVVNLELKRPIEVKDREIESAEIIRIIETIPNPEDLKTDVELAIYEKWGLESYRFALAIARAESNMNCNAVGINEGSADLGLFQVNTLWLKHFDLAQLATCQGNIDAAYFIWDRGDGEEGNNKGSWNPWVTAKNGAYLNFLE